MQRRFVTQVLLLVVALVALAAVAAVPPASAPASLHGPHGAVEAEAAPDAPARPSVPGCVLGPKLPSRLLALQVETGLRIEVRDLRGIPDPCAAIGLIEDLLHCGDECSKRPLLDALLALLEKTVETVAMTVNDTFWVVMEALPAFPVTEDRSDSAREVLAALEEAERRLVEGTGASLAKGQEAVLSALQIDPAVLLLAEGDDPVGLETMVDMAALHALLGLP